MPFAAILLSESASWLVCAERSRGLLRENEPGGLLLVYLSFPRDFPLY